jgi:hypothetical protein
MFVPFDQSGRQMHQLCWVVPDLRASMAEWTRLKGAGPWFLFENVRFEEALYRGKPVDFPNIMAAIGQMGDVQIELVSHSDARPSFFSEVVPHGRTGFHDIAYYCSDYDADLAIYSDAGVEVAFSAARQGIRTCWVDTVPTLGFMVQLAERSELMDGVFERIQEASRGWDGSDPIRKLG